MASKQVTDRQKAAAAIGAVVDTYGDRLRAGIEAVTESTGTGPKTAASAVAFARAAGQILASAASEMVSADEAHALELADDEGLRTDRDKLSSTLHDRLVQLREALSGLYGPTVPAAFGYSGDTPDDPVVVVRAAREVARSLRKVKLPAPRFPKATLDPAEEAAPLEDLANQLEAAIAEVTEDVRQNQLTKTARDAAMAAYDKTFSRAANLLTAMFAFAGEPELAERVRPSTRNPGRLAADPASQTEPAKTEEEGGEKEQGANKPSETES